MMVNIPNKSSTEEYNVTNTTALERSQDQSVESVKLEGQSIDNITLSTSPMTSSVPSTNNLVAQNDMNIIKDEVIEVIEDEPVQKRIKIEETNNKNQSSIDSWSNDATSKTQTAESKMEIDIALCNTAPKKAETSKVDALTAPSNDISASSDRVSPRPAESSELTTVIPGNSMSPTTATAANISSSATTPGSIDSSSSNYFNTTLTKPNPVPASSNVTSKSTTNINTSSASTIPVTLPTSGNPNMQVPYTSAQINVPSPISNVSTTTAKPFPSGSTSTITAAIASPLPVKVNSKKNRLILLYDKPRYSHMKLQLEELKKLENETITIVELNSINNLISVPELSKKSFDNLNICIEYNDEFENNLKKLVEFIEDNPAKIQAIPEIAYHFQFDAHKKWQEDYKDYEKQAYKRFLSVLNKTAGDQVVQCSVINKYEINTVYLTERNDLAKLGQEIQEDISYWKNLKTLDYGENCIRFFPGVKFPDSLEILNIAGGYSLETLAGFKMPPKLRILIACHGSISNIDNVSFPQTLERLELNENKIYFLNYVEFPPKLENLDVSQNRVDSLRGVNFPRNLKSLSLALNPIECIKGAKFPEGLEYLDLSCIPNESMTGVKFPDSLISLNLQESMTNTRGLKLPPFLREVNLGDNGVNSINPLKLPNSIEKLYLNNNNIKTLNKVQFPTSLKELYLGNNLITTLKNVQFPSGLELLDLEMDPDIDDNDKHITTLKDVIFPSNLRVLKLGYHSIKSLESIEFPYNLQVLSLAYNELRIIRNIRFGPHLKTLDLSGNQELTNIDHLLIPESVNDLRIPSQLSNNIPAYIVERANRKQLIISKSAPY